MSKLYAQVEATGSQGTYAELDDLIEDAVEALVAAVACAELPGGEVAADTDDDHSGEQCLGVLQAARLLYRLGNSIGCPRDVIISEPAEDAQVRHVTP